MPASPRVLIWNEFRHEKTHDAVKRIYPQGIRRTLADALQSLLPGKPIRTATQDEPEHGLSDATLANTDVLLWWAPRPTARCATRSSSTCSDGFGRGWGSCFCTRHIIPNRSSG